MNTRVAVLEKCDGTLYPIVVPEEHAMDVLCRISLVAWVDPASRRDICDARDTMLNEYNYNELSPLMRQFNTLLQAVADVNGTVVADWK